MGKIILNGTSYGNGGGGSADIVEVTLAEYIALGDVVNTDGKLYCITDLNNSDVQGYPPLIYSTDEREVGVWIDGKPLYQKTWVLDSPLSCATNTWVDTPIPNTGMQRIVKGFANDIFDNGGVSQSNSFLYLSFAVNATTYVRILNARPTAITVNAITLQYTKTTDTAGSGIWNGQGGYAHHYSTSEKVIGTWVDGKPLYEITSRITQDLSLTANTWVKSQFDQGTKKALYKTMIVNDSGAVIDNVAGGFVDNKIAINSPRTLTVLANTGYLIMQYTKTTD